MLLQQVIDLYHSLFLLFACLSLWLPPFSTQLLFLSSFLPFWGPSELRCSEALRVNWSWPVLHQAGGGHCSGAPRILILGAEEVQALNMFLPYFLPSIHTQFSSAPCFNLLCWITGTTVGKACLWGTPNYQSVVSHPSKVLSIESV